MTKLLSSDEAKWKNSVFTSCIHICWVILWPFVQNGINKNEILTHPIICLVFIVEDYVQKLQTVRDLSVKFRDENMSSRPVYLYQ
jgi:hypothetical protein